jgi:hypothetical protein
MDLKREFGQILRSCYEFIVPLLNHLTDLSPSPNLSAILSLACDGGEKDAHQTKGT